MSGHDPVAKPNPDTNAADSFPKNPQYDLFNITEFQKKIAVLMEKINHIVEHDASTEHLRNHLAVINVINELKASLDQWSQGMISSNKTTETIKQQNASLATNLLSSKVYLGQLVHEVQQNGTDSTELVCKINNLFEEIKNITGMDVQFEIALVTDCSDPSDSECSSSPDNTTDTTDAHIQHVEKDIEDLSFHPNLIGSLAICFAVVSILSYIGLISWRYILE